MNKSRNIKRQKEWKLNMIQGYLYQKMIEVKASMKQSKWTRVLRGLNLDMLTFIDNTTKNSISGSLSYKVIPKVIMHSQKRLILFIKRFWFFSIACTYCNSCITFQSANSGLTFLFIQTFKKFSNRKNRKVFRIITTISLFWFSELQRDDFHLIKCSFLFLDDYVIKFQFEQETTSGALFDGA